MEAKDGKRIEKEEEEASKKAAEKGKRTRTSLEKPGRISQPNAVDRMNRSRGMHTEGDKPWISWIGCKIVRESNRPIFRIFTFWFPLNLHSKPSLDTLK
jgi:hypothetical protein